MAWTPKPGATVDLKDAPRSLTELEINYIIDGDPQSNIPPGLPPIQAADAATAEVARYGLSNWLRLELHRIELCPSAIDELRQTIRFQFEKSVIQPGTTVGITVAESIGATTSQMALNSFHSSGTAKNISQGITALRELLFARKERKNKSCSIYFKDRGLTFEGVLEKRADIVGVLISDVLAITDAYKVGEAEDFPRYWWHTAYSGLATDPNAKVVATTGTMMRLRFDVQRLYAFRVTLETIVVALETEHPQSIRCVHSPTSEGIIDIYPNDNVVLASLRERGYTNLTVGNETFLTCYVLPALQKIRLKGVAGIRRLFPVLAPVWSVVLVERLLFPSEVEALNIDARDAPRSWFISLNIRKMLTTGIWHDHFDRLFAVLGATRRDRRDNDALCVVTLPPTVTVSPGTYLRGLLAADEEVVDDHVVKRGVRPPPSDLYHAAHFAYADTDGSNLYELLGREDVDEIRTISNLIHEVAEVLGVEAAWSYFTKELNEVIENAQSYVNPRIIMLAADFIFSRGTPLGIAYAGVSRQPVGHLSLATMERAMTVLRTAAAFGKEENIRTTSAAIATGQLPSIGTSVVDTLVDKEAEGRFMAEMEERDRKRPSGRPSQVSVFDLEKGLAELDALPRTGAAPPPVPPHPVGPPTIGLPPPSIGEPLAPPSGAIPRISLTSPVFSSFLSIVNDFGMKGTPTLPGPVVHTAVVPIPPVGAALPLVSVTPDISPQEASALHIPPIGGEVPSALVALLRPIMDRRRLGSMGDIDLPSLRSVVLGALPISPIEGRVSVPYADPTPLILLSRGTSTL